jgi:hypothetical protein
MASPDLEATLRAQARLLATLPVVWLLAALAVLVVDSEDLEISVAVSSAVSVVALVALGMAVSEAVFSAA